LLYLLRDYPEKQYQIELFRLETSSGEIR
jgi:hypothetical protein